MLSIMLCAGGTVSSNLSRSQQQGLKSLLKKKEDLHFSVSDKCGEFVVTTAAEHHTITHSHLESNNIYQKIMPTRKVKGQTVEILNPTRFHHTQLIKRKTKELTETSNKLWRDIVGKRDLPFMYQNLMSVSGATMPCIYTLVKTHKNPPDAFNSHFPLEELKVRPIISCSGSPTEKLAWLVTEILSPLLKFVPSHLTNLYQHLEELQTIPQDQLVGQKFWTAVH